MPALKQRISQEVKAAFLGGDRFRGEVLRDLQAAILNEEVALGVRDVGLGGSEVEKVVIREVKKRAESAELYRQNARDDLAETEERQMSILEDYLPKQMSQDEVRQVVDEVVDSIDDVSIKQMGQVIGQVKARVGNSADGALIAKIVKETLTK